MATRKTRPRTRPSTRPRREAAPAPPPSATADEPLLDIHDIQGNILAGFNKDRQVLLAFNFRGIPDARAWLTRILPCISSMAEVAQFNSLYSMQRKKLGRDPAGLIATWANIAFSHAGISKLTSEVEANAIPDTSFQAGLTKERSEFLGDPVPPGETDPTVKWVMGGTNRIPDALVIVASDDQKHLDDMVTRVHPTAADGPDAPEEVWREQGDTRMDMPGHEHFGFKDGISQPAVRGLVSKQPRILLAPRVLKSAPDGQIDFAKPGQPLIWPGNFVLGYSHTSRNDGAAMDPVPLEFPWFKNGSFLVFRRLNQNVAGFASFLTTEAARLAATPAFQGITPAHLGTLFVGRWPSGAPLSRASQADNPALALDNLSNNDFVFTVDTPPPDFLPQQPTPPTPFPPAMEGTNGPICPHAAHIFKVNPRDVATNVGPDFDTLTRRILRRGIPFGPPLVNPLNGDDGVPRGLHFLCYQASIVDQFEFLQQNWANSTGGPVSGGHDIIIGQTPDKIRKIDNLATVAGQPGETVTAPTQWVTPTGGGYFFAPSLSAIRKELAKAE